VAIDQQRRLQQAAAEAHRAQDQGDVAAANDAWRRYVLIEDALRDPQQRLDEGVALSRHPLRHGRWHGELPDDQR
jgi:type II secretory pathway component PulK